ncbi:LCP family protein required for cell wall assembly [Bacillus thermophilus]|uniref:LCP family protein required for cell wall assembly n=1 Tax=Siminovitchia thermophila TaxID=1245522 RepID=A0ABS2R6G7_9BACI|nr:LCP family protein [Siminovitchia thermophila]MBM7714965.1 LCP family protein required for cell wall assembly [Siminovitchia thermophila]
MEQTRLIKKKKKRKKLKIFVFFIILLLVGAPLTYGGYLFFTIKNAAGKSYTELEREKSEYRIEDVKLGKDPVSILLIGVEDYLEDGPGRSDALLLVTLNPETKEVATLSIPRDTRTYIKTEGKKDKINHAYAFGGVQATIQAVEDLFELPVDYYVETNIKGFQDIVNELGGITVDVPFDFKQVGMDGNMIYFNQGEAKLNGREALAFVQMRKEDPRGDFGRQERQQIALRAIADKALSISSLAKIDNAIDAVSDSTKTNISLNELLGLRNFYNEIKNQEINILQLEGEDTRINDVYYFVPHTESINEVRNELSQILEIEDNIDNTGESINE